MSDHASNQGDKQIPRGDDPGKPKADALEAKPVTGAEIGQAENARTNASDGSLRKFSPDHAEAQERSIELVDHDRVVSRLNPGSEKELVNPRSKDAALDQLSKTASELVVLAKDQPQLEPVVQLRKYADSLAPGEQKDQLTKLSREQAAELSPEMSARLQAREQQGRQIDAQGLDRAGSFKVDSLKASSETASTKTASIEATSSETASTKTASIEATSTKTASAQTASAQTASAQTENAHITAAPEREAKHDSAKAQPDLHADAHVGTVADNAVGKKLHDLSQLSPNLKRLSDDVTSHIKNPDCQRNFTQSLEKFQQRKDLDQGEKDRVYDQLARLLEANSSKLEPWDKKFASKENWTPERAGKEDQEMRAVLATDLIYHAAMPHRVDQGDFNTCNVTTQAERLFTRHPSIAAEIAVTTALKGEWVNPRDTTNHVIKIDHHSLRPAEDMDTIAIPPQDATRSMDVQLLNMVMVNDITQRGDPPKMYVQQDKIHITDPFTNKTETDNGERLYYWDPINNKRLGAVTETVHTAQGDIVQNVNSPCLSAKPNSDMGTRLTGESHYFIIPWPAATDPVTHKPVDDGLVHVDSVDKMKAALEEMNKHHSFPAIVHVDAHSPLFDAHDNFGPGSGHVVCVWGYDKATGRVHISNQWGKESDIVANVDDLYEACQKKSGPVDDLVYPALKLKFQKYGYIKHDPDA